VVTIMPADDFDAAAVETPARIAVTAWVVGRRRPQLISGYVMYGRRPCG
jgi:hypothetical protein